MSDDEYSSGPPTPDRKPTSKLERPSVPSRTDQEDIVTMTRCPICQGCGMVVPEIAVLAEGILAEMQEEQ
jgi:hypothetical protein